MFTRRAIKNFILHRVNYQTVCLFVDTMLVNRTFLFVILLHFIFQDLTLCKFQPVYHLLPRLISQSLPRFFLFFFFFISLFKQFSGKEYLYFPMYKTRRRKQRFKIHEISFIYYKWNIYFYLHKIK